MNNRFIYLDHAAKACEKAAAKYINVRKLNKCLGGIHFGTIKFTGKE